MSYNEIIQGDFFTIVGQKATLDFFGGAFMSTYQTIASTNEASIEVKRSRFIAVATPVSSREEAEKFLETVRRTHYNAKHHVYAFQLRKDNLLKYSDDGEPSGTAGKPIAEILRRRSLTDLMIVVTRYFGGILLGTGGLAHAYSDATQLVLSNTPVIIMMEVTRMQCRCDYSLYGRLPSLIASFGGEIETTDFADRVLLSFIIPTENSRDFQIALRELSLGKTEAIAIETAYIQQKKTNL